MITFTDTDVLLAIVAALAGAISAVTGFGIGSLLTPLLAFAVDIRLAVAAVAIPHVAGTALRFWLIDASVDRGVFRTFGLTSAAGGLIGALMHGWAGSRWLTAVFGLLLLLAAAGEVTGLARRMRFRGAGAWIAGAVSGVLGGLVGNQGGIRSAALLGFDLPRTTFVATATAVALVIDGARLPVYLLTQGRDLAAIGGSIAVATAGVLAGTLLGSRVLRWIPESAFRRVLAVILAVLGTWMLIQAAAAS